MRKVLSTNDSLVNKYAACISQEHELNSAMDLKTYCMFGWAAANYFLLKITVKKPL